LLTQQIPDTHTSLLDLPPGYFPYKTLSVFICPPYRKALNAGLSAYYIRVFHTNFRKRHKIGYIISNKFCSYRERERGGREESRVSNHTETVS